MNDFVRLDQAIRRSTTLAATVCAILLVVTIASASVAAGTAWVVRRSAMRMPVLVVPGAIAGVYSPGLTEENVRAAARYMVGLGTSFNGPRGMDQRFDELETFASPQFLPRLQAARLLLRRDVEVQNQARVFYDTPASEAFAQSSPGRFEYSVSGRLIVYASGITMDSRGSTVTLKLSLGVPSEKNRIGILLDGFAVVNTSAAKPEPTP